MGGKRWMWTGAIGAGLLLIGGAAWSLQGSLAYARIATGYAAKQTCSCLHVSGRPLESCLGDFPTDARGQISVREDGARVHASVLFGAVKADAVFEEEYGCTLLN